MAKLVINRLSRPDCEFNGYILENFPETIQQYHMLKEARKDCKLVCYREYDYSNVHENRQYYKYDPLIKRNIVINPNDNKNRSFSLDEIKRLITSP